MRFLLTALGSYGDVHPFVALGRTLSGRGHDVALISNPHFQSLIERAGLRFIPLGTTDDYDALTQNPNLWRTIGGPRLVLETGVRVYMRDLFEIVRRETVSDKRPNGTTAIAHGLDFCSRIIQEKYGVPAATVALAPLQIRSVDAPPNMPGFFRAWNAPRWVRGMQHYVADRIVIDRIVGGPVNALRAELGLTPPVKRVLDRWWYSPQLIVCLFPDWFGPPQPDWPPNSVLAGFPLWDQSEHAELPEDVAAFLDAGEPPVVFSPGSAMRVADSFFVEAIRACQMVRRRAMLLTKYPEQLPPDLPDGVGRFAYAPFSQVLPRAAAFVHHGGIGSSSQGLAAGVPQLVAPWNFDQPDNAERLCNLGVAESIPIKRFRAPAVAASLERLIAGANSPQYGKLADRCDGQVALATACDALERLSGGG